MFIMFTVLIKIKKISKFRLISYKKTNIATGLGSCARDGTTDENTYYCGTGADCNSFEGRTCWSPVKNGQATCKSSDWQCKVSIFLVSTTNV
jgi:hypothetical protein